MPSIAPPPSTDLESLLDALDLADRSVRALYLKLAESPSVLNDEIDMIRTIESIVEKHGRSGAFVLVTWQTVYHNQRRELVAEATTSMIARPLGAP